jgi:hypothetical protein
VRRLAVTLSGLALLVSLAACGGDSEAGGAKGQYITDGDAICNDTNSELAAVGTGSDTATLEKIRDAMARAYERLNALPVPADDEARALQFVAEVHNAALTMEAAVQASIINDQAKVQKSLADFQASTERVTKVAKDYGFKVCSQT